MLYSTAALSARQTVSLGTGVLLGLGVALYQMTSLVVAPASNQQISMSLRTRGAEPDAVMAGAAGGGRSSDGAIPVAYRRAIVEPAPSPRPIGGPAPSNRPGQSGRSAPPAPVAGLVLTLVQPTTTVVPEDEPARGKHTDGDGSGRRERD